MTSIYTHKLKKFCADLINTKNVCHFKRLNSPTKCHFRQLGILPIMPLVPGYPCSIPGYPCPIPVYPCSIPVYPCSIPGCPWCPCCPGVILGFIPVGQEDSVAAPCSLSLTMVEAGDKLHLPVMKWGLLLNNMDAMTLQMWLLSAKMSRPNNHWESFSSSTWKLTSDEGWEGEERMQVGHSRKWQC